MPTHSRRWWWLAGGALVLVAVAAVAYVAGGRVGTVPAPPGRRAAAPPGTAPDTGGGPEQPLPVLTVSAFDPSGGDGDPATAWTTERYVSAAFSGLKPGVGLLLELRSPLQVGRAVVTIPRGETVQLLAAATGASAPPTWLRDLQPRTPATEAAAGGATTLVPAAGPASRWWVLWLTRLPTARAPDPGSFQGAVAELALYSGA